jgi:hypothetical protein
MGWENRPGKTITLKEEKGIHRLYSIELPRGFIYAQKGYSRAIAFKRSTVSSLGGVVASFACDLFLSALLFPLLLMDVLSEGK